MYNKILKSEPFTLKSPKDKAEYNQDFCQRDAKFVEETLKPLMLEAYAHVHSDAITLLDELLAHHVPVFVHTGSQLTEFIDKLCAASDYSSINDYEKPIKFTRNKNDELVVKRCVFTGFSVCGGLTPGFLTKIYLREKQNSL